MRPASAKAKGRKFQQAIAADIRRTFLLDSADAVSRPMGSGGDDIMLSAAARARFPFAVECKHVEALNLWTAFAQVVKRATATPLLVFRRNHSEPMVALRWVDFLALLERAALL